MMGRRFMKLHMNTLRASLRLRNNNGMRSNDVINDLNLNAFQGVKVNKMLSNDGDKNQKKYDQEKYDQEKHEEKHEEEDEEYEEMFVKTTFGELEWGGPLRGGRLPEPTRFGDWERKARCTDF